MTGGNMRLTREQQHHIDWRRKFCKLRTKLTTISWFRLLKVGQLSQRWKSVKLDIWELPKKTRVIERRMCANTTSDVAKTDGHRVYSKYSVMCQIKHDCNRKTGREAIHQHNHHYNVVLFANETDKLHKRPRRAPILLHQQSLNNPRLTLFLSVNTWIYILSPVKTLYSNKGVRTLLPGHRLYKKPDKRWIPGLNWSKRK